MARVCQEVTECQHVAAGKYYVSGHCATPYCAWSEFRCGKCQQYVQRCGCGFMNSESGWAAARWARNKGGKRTTENVPREAPLGITTIGN